jgi:hypothetical protein
MAWMLGSISTCLPNVDWLKLSSLLR